MRRRFLSYFPLLVLFLLWFLLVYKNFTAGTWLTGWDNLHPEFNFPLNISRSLSAVWQEYQGLGLLGGMAHAADLPRQLILWATSMVLPQHLIRYFWTFLMLLIGPLGVYFLFKNKLAGLVSSLFYLLNLATVQYFFTPFDVFVSFYGFLPWLIAFATQYLREGGRKNLLIFLLVTFFATPSFYVQTLFVVYIAVLSLILLEYLLREGSWKRTAALIAIIFTVNSYWLLPVSYFTLTNSQVLYQSHINSIGTPETELLNKARSNFSDIVNLKGYWLDYYDLGKDGKFDYLYSDWINHLNDPLVSKLGIGLFGIAVVGFFLSVFSKKSLLRFSGLPLVLLVYLMLGNHDWLSRFPIVVEMFRNSFTKWSVAAAFIFSLGIGSFIFFLGKFLKSLILIPALLVVVASVYITRPAFGGKLISDRVELSIPQEYFQVFDYFKDKPQDGRIATLPIQSFWGWIFTNWGYRGGGFVWYGIRQPALDRNFDVWSKNNENFYDEANFAIYSNNPGLFKDVLKKYQVSYLLLDESIVNSDNVGDISFIGKTKDFLARIPEIKEAKRFGFLTVYETNLVNTEFFVSVADNLTSNVPPIYGRRISWVDSNVPIKDRTIETFAADRGLSQAKNCDLKAKGTVSKARNGGFTYKAENGGIECDFLNYDNVAYNRGYVLHIKGENKAGRGLKIYLQNWQTQKIEIQELLPTGKFDVNFLLLPQNYSGSGYTLNLETRSFGNIASENVVSQIEFIPVSANGLINLGSLEGPSLQGNLEVRNVKKYGTWLYKVETTGEGLLELGQGYEQGWIALQVKSSKFKIQSLEHLKVNSWANGWVLSQPSTVNRQQLTVIIVYWPQLLEYLGFVFLVGTFPAILAWPERSRTA